MNKKYNCSINIISPIHIGSGNVYSPAEYYIDKNKLMRVNIIDYYKNISNKKEKEIFLDKLLNQDFILKEQVKLDKTIKNYILYENDYKCKSEPTIIEEHIKTLDKNLIKGINENKLYIPGSSIKGAIRTALVYYLLKTVKTPPSSKKMYYSFINANLIDEMMQSIKISDSSVTNFSAIHDMKPIQINNRDKKNNMYNALETIKPKTILNNTIKMENKEKRKTFNIKKCLYYFANDHINNEMKFAKTSRSKELTNFYGKLKKENKESSPLLRIGSGSGLMGKTIAMFIKNNNPHLFNQIYNPQKNKYHKKDDEIFPKIRKITNKTNEPLGWTKITFE